MSRSDLCDLTRYLARPLLDDPVGMLTRPLDHGKLAIHGALGRSHTLTLEVEANILATRRLVDHANREDEFNHSQTPRLDAHAHFKCSCLLQLQTRH